MKGKNRQPKARLSPAMVEAKTMERLKKRAQDLGLIVNAGSRKLTKATGQQKGGKK